MALVSLATLIFIYHRQKSRLVRILETHSIGLIRTCKSQKVACVCYAVLKQYGNCMLRNFTSGEVFNPNSEVSGFLKSFLCGFDLAFNQLAKAVLP